MQISRTVKLALISFFIQLLIVSPTLVAQQEIKDKDITLAVEKELFLDEQVPSHLIDVETNDGIVTLSGSVNNILAKDRAIRVAQSIKGVRSVVDEMEVKPVNRSDSQIRRDVVEALRLDPATYIIDLEVEVKDAVVTLNGEVESFAERELCAQVAKGVKGVKGIDNNIQISYTGERSDYEIEAEIEKRLQSDIWVDEGLIQVNVEDGEVTLEGTAGSAAEKRQAEVDAWVTGVENVENQLTVQWWKRDQMQREQEMDIKSDEKVREAVQDALSFDPRVSQFAVDVDVDDGVVTLTGTVDNLKAKNAAEKDAENTLGVWQVQNHIRVRPEVYLTDKEIAYEVRNALSNDPYVEVDDINIEVINAEVFLRGKVDSFFEKTHAEDVTSRVKGVVEIKNNLMIETGWQLKNDWEIKQDIEEQLEWSPYVDIKDVNVNVQSGIATLEGTVDTWLEYNVAMDCAMDGGARRVINELEVQYGPEQAQP